MMTRQRIEQYSSIKREISMLEDQIYAAENVGEFVADMVRGSTKEIPYAMHSIVIEGYTSQHVPKLYNRKKLLEDECAVIENYIEAVENSIMRQLLVRRYIEGHSIVQAAQLVGYSEIHAKRLYKKFFAKMIPNDT